MNSEQVKALLTTDLIMWNELACLLEKHPDVNLHAKGIPWISRDVYAHFARWFNRSNAHIEAYCNGKELPQLSKTPEEMNDIWQKEDQHLSLAQARTKAGVAFTSRLVAIESIPPDKWDAEMSRLVNVDGAVHYAMHINYIMRENPKLQILNPKQIQNTK
jgi:hypothetical protein